MEGSNFLERKREGERRRLVVDGQRILMKLVALFIILIVIRMKLLGRNRMILMNEGIDGDGGEVVMF